MLLLTVSQGFAKNADGEIVSECAVFAMNSNSPQLQAQIVYPFFDVRRIIHVGTEDACIFYAMGYVDAKNSDGRQIAKKVHEETFLDLTKGDKKWAHC